MGGMGSVGGSIPMGNAPRRKLQPVEKKTSTGGIECSDGRHEALGNARAIAALLDAAHAG